MVLTIDGNKPIEEIKAGDFVYSTDPTTGKSEYKEVVQTFENETDELVHVTVDGEEIVTTPKHPFYVPQKGWTSAIDLRAGDMLVLSNGEYVTVEKVQHEILEEPVKVYNFEVRDFHTYYVGENSVLVHNECGDKVYRVIREDEVPQSGLTAKNPDASYTVEGHILNGSKSGFKSQYISTTTDLEVAKKWASKTGNRIVEIDINSISSNTNIYDLSYAAGRKNYLKGITSNRWAKASSEVLIEGYIPPSAIKLLE